MTLLSKLEKTIHNCNTLRLGMKMKYAFVSGMFSRETCYRCSKNRIVIELLQTLS